MQQEPLRAIVAELLLELARHLRRRTHPLRQGDLTPEQFWLLKRLWVRGTLRIGELAAELGVTPGSVTVACKRLERLGLVQRERGAGGDERIVTVSLTEEGRRRLMAWHEARRGYLIELLSALGTDELATLRPLLERLVATAEQLEREDGGADAPR
ncbi:MAG: MarR family transcriptional regulator [Thermomicrobium sp.]|nr:MarR family transcriptional regulator [Thermomicrobium sp.]MDW8007765.1 MarR family transcriptional regulator [Thermomicrobium sp.]